MEGVFLTLAWEVIFGSKKRGITANVLSVYEVVAIEKHKFQLTTKAK